jgi:hypothetical protein
MATLRNKKEVEKPFPSRPGRRRRLPHHTHGSAAGSAHMWHRFIPF